MHVLDPSLMNVNLVERARALLKKDWHGTADRTLAQFTFANVHLKAINFVDSSGHRPLRRVLNFQARQARTHAISKGWVPAQWDFQDFESDGQISIKQWIDHNLLQPGSPRNLSDSGSEA